MSDFVDRQAVYDTIYQLPVKVDDLGYTWMIANDVLKQIDDIPSVESERKWIPVTEALPKMKEVVLITNGKGHVRCGKYQGIFDNKNYRWWWKHKTLEEVLAWMPLPESYKDE